MRDPGLYFLLLLSLILSLHSAISNENEDKEDDCPHRCECKWRDGKQTVDCFNASLSGVPTMNTETQVLNLNHNYLPILKAETFRNLKLVHLQKIYLSNCFIREVQDHCFRGLTNLVDLDLSYNSLSSIPSLEDALYLMRLSLMGNPIRRVPASAFSNLRDLNTLELNDCALDMIDKNAFTGLHHLQYLKLHSNNLQHFSPSTNSFPPNLRDLTLYGNAWLCNCKLLELHNWLKNYSVPYSVEPKCASPSRVAKADIRTLEEKEFACVPLISPSSSYREVIEGKNVSLLCNIRATPSATVYWYYKDTLIQNGSTLISDIDMRNYYHLESQESAELLISRLFLSSTSVDDNGTFSCVAKNNAGRARAEFFLHVVVPMPPKPPQDVVEDRFRMEYLIAIVVAGSLLLVISMVVIGLFVLRCRRVRTPKVRKNFVVTNSGTEETSLQSRGSLSSSKKGSPSPGRLQNSALAEFGSTDTLSTQMTATPSMPSTTTTTHSALVVHHSTSVDDSLCTSGHTYHTTTKTSLPPEDLNFPPPPLLGSKQEATTIITEESSSGEKDEEEAYHEDLCFQKPKSISKSSNPQGFGSTSGGSRLSPPTPFADEKTDFSKTATLLRMPASSKQGGRQGWEENNNSRGGSRTLPRKTSSLRMKSKDSNLVLPPPPQYKGVHFAPIVEKMSIPTEGLPLGPATHPNNNNNDRNSSPPNKKRKPLPPQRKGSSLSSSSRAYYDNKDIEENEEEEESDCKSSEEKSLLLS